MPSTDVAVVGGGIVGTTAALELQRRGHAVTIVERNEPGAGTAAGSAGYLAYDDIFPIPSPAVVAGLPRMLFDRNGPLVVQPRYAAHLIGWGLRFIAAARPSSVRAAIAALAPINRAARQAHESLASRTGAARYLVKESVFHVCATNKTFEATAALIPLLRQEGFGAEAIDAQRLHSAEPILRGGIAGAVAFPNSHRCTNPGAYGAAIASAFVAGGGGVVRGRATTIASARGGWSVNTDAGAVDAAHVVLAAGAWSSPLLAPLGYRVPLESARGYHLMLQEPAVIPSRTLLFEEDHFCATPMEAGLRLAGTVEFAGLGAPANFYRSDILYDIARRYIPGLAREPATRWMGNRPSLPDSLPVIGALPRHPAIVAAFGHERRGLMQAAITALCVADVVEGKTPPIDISPFRITRF
ncbi:MAG: NAD(P)/FAD-dependent oxidoreductase [Candidatus Tyrphobacter sp.]